MHEGSISIWFFIGISLLVNGALILASGVWEVFHPPQTPPVLFDLHAAVWWGALLLIIGIFYSIRFSPSRKS